MIANEKYNKIGEEHTSKDHKITLEEAMELAKINAQNLQNGTEHEREAEIQGILHETWEHQSQGGLVQGPQERFQDSTSDQWLRFLFSRWRRTVQSHPLRNRCSQGWKEIRQLH